jgi:hypothetical protein
LSCKDVCKKAAAALLLVSLSLNSVGALAVDEVRLRDGTRVTVRLAEPLSSATAKEGEVVTFEVLEDVVVDGEVIIRAGSPARGAIVEAAKKRRMGRAGKLSYGLTETTSVDRQVVRLRAMQDRQGDSNVTSTAVTTAAVAVFVPVAAPLVLLRKGKDINVPQGTRVDAFVDGEHTIRLAKPAPASAVASGAVTGPQMTNADVLGLVHAGFGEELIVARVRGASPGFDLSTSSLIELKRA